MNNAEGETDSTNDAVRPYGKDNDLGYFQRIASVDFPFTIILKRILNTT